MSRRRRAPAPSLVPGLATLAALLVALVLGAAPAGADWLPAAAGTGTATALTLGVPTAPAASALASTTIRISWAAPGGGVTPTGYEVTKVAPTTATVCTVPASTFSCDNTVPEASSASYVVRALRDAWISDPTAVVSATTPAPGPFLLAPSTATPTAGSPFTVTVTATTDGSTVDTAYDGVKTLTWSGPGASPSGASPSYPATVTFSAGVGTATITLFAAEGTTLTATAGLRSGATSLTVGAATPTQLRFTSSTPDCSGGSVVVGFRGRFTSRVSQYDAYLNPAPQTGFHRSVGISRSPAIGSLNRTSVTIRIGDSESSQQFRYRLPPGGPPPVTVTASSPGLTSVACVVSES